MMMPSSISTTKLSLSRSLKGLDKLAEEAGDWRIHLPYEAILGYRSNKAIQEQFEDHYNACAYCQELMDTLCPGD